MKNFVVFWGSVFFLSLSLYACMAPLISRSYTLDEINRLDGVDRIELHVLEKKINDAGYEARHIRSIRNPDEISVIVKEVKSYSDNWQNQEFGATSPLLGIVRVTFYEGQELETEFGIGYTDDNIFYLRKFLGPGRFLEENEFRSLMNILEIDETNAYYKSSDP